MENSYIKAIIVYKGLLLSLIAWNLCNYNCKLLVLDKNTWNYITVWKQTNNSYLIWTNMQILAQKEMQTESSRIWAWITDSIYKDNSSYATQLVQRIYQP